MSLPVTFFTIRNWTEDLNISTPPLGETNWTSRSKKTKKRDPKRLYLNFSHMLALPLYLLKTNKKASRLPGAALLRCFPHILKSSDMNPQRKAASKRIKTALFQPWQAPAGLSALRHFGSASLSCWQSHWHQRHFSHTVRPLSAPRLPTRPNHLVWTTDCLAGWLYASHAPASDNKQEVICGA